MLNALTRSKVHVEDRLFATLDPSSRRLKFPQDLEVIITDTVGFIRDLPPDLAAAFRATLEELRDADLFLHVVDATVEDPEQRIETVRGVLREMGYEDTPELLVFNQADRLPAGVADAIAQRAGGVAISALRQIGLRELLEQVEKTLWTEDLSALHRERLTSLATEGVGR